MLESGNITPRNPINLTGKAGGYITDYKRGHIFGVIAAHGFNHFNYPAVHRFKIIEVGTLNIDLRGFLKLSCINNLRSIRFDRINRILSGVCVRIGISGRVWGNGGCGGICGLPFYIATILRCVILVDGLLVLGNSLF